MSVAPGGPESTDDPPTPPTPITEHGSPASLKPLEELLADGKEQTSERFSSPVAPFMPPAGMHDFGDPPTAPTARDKATPLSNVLTAEADNEDPTPRTHRGPGVNVASNTPSLKELRRSAPERKPPGLWARIKAWLGL